MNSTQDIADIPRPHDKRSLVLLPSLEAAGSTVYRDVQIAIDDILDEGDRVMTRRSAAEPTKVVRWGLHRQISK